MARIGVVANPSSGGGRGAAGSAVALGVLRASAHEIIDLSGQSFALARANAERAVADGSIDCLVVIGGDGMMHLGVNVTAETGLPLGIIAAGTGNDSARTLGMPVGDPAAGARAILESLDSTRKVDAIRAEAATGDFWTFGSVSAGFDSIVNARANGWRWPRGASKYQLAMVRELPVFKPIQFRATIDGKVREIEAMLCSVANGPAYGGGMLIAPEASVDDGFADLFIVHKISRLELIKVFPKVYTGEHVSHPAVEIVRAKVVSLEADVPTSADGELTGRAPVTATLVPGALTVISRV